MSTPSPLHAHPGTILDLVSLAQAEGRPASFAIQPTFRHERAELIGAAIDNGNRGLKGAIFGADGRLHTLVVPAIFREARAIQGQQETSYEIDGQRFWVGEAAFRERGDALPIGPTATRLADERQRWFIFAGLVELLRTAGYAPGSYQVMLALAVPNTEIVVALSPAGDETLATDERARAAIAAHLKDKTVAVTRRGDDGSIEAWTVRIAGVFPQAQTIARSTPSPRGPRAPS